MFRLNMVYQPSTLRNLAKKSVRQVYKNHWMETNVLPKFLQRELLLDWLKCEETIQESDEDIERIVQSMENGWDAMKPIGPLMYISLMRLPEGVPTFAFERNHIIWDYYIWTEGNIERKICHCCFAAKGRSFRLGSANRWLEKNWTFKRVTDHTMVDGEYILDFLIWKEKNWCSICIIEPLWEHILDDYDCFNDYSYHLKKRRRWSSSSSEDDDIDYRRVNNIIGDRMDPVMYEWFKKL